MFWQLAESWALLHSHGDTGCGGLEDWDAILRDPTLALRQATLLLELLRTKNGRPSWQKGQCVMLRLAGNASDRAYAAFLLDGQLTEVMCAPFSQKEADRIAWGVFSITEWEFGSLQYAINCAAAGTRPARRQVAAVPTR